MKKRMYLLLLMLCMTVGAFAQDSSFTTGVLSKDKSNFSLIRVRIIQDTLGSWYLTPDARRFITGEALDAISKGKHNFYLVESSPMPRHTHLWGRELYREYNVVAEEGVIDTQFIGLKFGPATRKNLLMPVIIFSGICFLVCFFLAFIFPKAGVNNIRKLFGFCFVLWILIVGAVNIGFHFASQPLDFFDSIFLALIIALPSFLITFTFRKRRKRKEEEGHLQAPTKEDLERRGEIYQKNHTLGSGQVV